MNHSDSKPPETGTDLGPSRVARLWDWATTQTEGHASRKEVLWTLHPHQGRLLKLYWSVIAMFCLYTAFCPASILPFSSSTRVIFVLGMFAGLFGAGWIFVRAGRRYGRPGSFQHLVVAGMFAFVSACLALGLVWTFLELSFAGRGQATVIDLAPGTSFALLPLSFVAVGLVGFYAAFQLGKEQRLKLHHLATALAGASCVALAFAVPVELGLYTPSAAGQPLAGARLAIDVALPALLWSAGVFVHVLKLAPAQPAEPKAAIEGDGLEGASYISMARNYSFVILLVLFAAMNGVQAHLKRVRLLTDARHSFAVNYLSQSRPEVSPLADMPARELPDVTGVGHVAITTTTSPRSIVITSNSVVWRRDTQAHSFEVTRSNGEKWRTVVHDAEIEAGATNNSSARLVAVFQKSYGIDPDDSIRADPVKLYTKIEYQLEPAQTELPGFGLQLRSSAAPWIFAAVVLGLLVQIRSQLRRATLDADVAISEPWLAIDARDGLERVVAGAWIFSLVLAPWLANGCLLAFCAGDTVLSGGVRSLAVQLLAGGATLTLILVGAWASVTTTSELLRVRRWRLDEITDLRRQDTGAAARLRARGIKPTSPK